MTDPTRAIKIARVSNIANSAFANPFVLIYRTATVRPLAKLRDGTNKKRAARLDGPLFEFKGLLE
jgi:hypothetical protein